MGFFAPKFKLVTSRGWANFDPRGIIWTNLVEVHKEMLHTKYQGLHLPVSEKKNFEDGPFCTYVPTCDPRVGPVLTPGASYEELGRGPEGDAIYQIWKL